METQNISLKLGRRIESGLDVLSKIMAIIASIVLAGMMLLTTADVIGRYFFSKPIWGGFELVSLLLIFAGTWGWGYCQREKLHVRVTVLTERFSRKVNIIINIFTYLIGFAGFSLICWRMCIKARTYYFLGSSGLTHTLELPYYPFMLALAIGAAVMAIILLLDLIRTLAEMVQK